MSGERLKIRFGRSLSCSMNNHITKMFYCGFVSYAFCMSHLFPSCFTYWPLNIFHFFICPQHRSENLKLPSHSVILSLLPTQKEAESNHGSVNEGTLTLQQTTKEENWALSFSLSVWESGILEYWMTLAHRFKIYWREANRQTDI